MVFAYSFQITSSKKWSCKVVRKSINQPGLRIFGELLRDMRTDMSLTQEMLARKLGVDQAFVSEAERGRRRLDIVQIGDWCIECEADFGAAMEEYWRRRNDPKYEVPREPDGRKKPRS